MGRNEATERGFGIAGALDRAIVAELAEAAEEAGYHSFWANDTPGGDGLKALAAASQVTSEIRLGVGVIPIDRRTATEIAKSVDTFGLPQERLLLGLGAGAMTTGSRDTVQAAAEELRTKVRAKVVVGALGPGMCAVAGSAADGVLLNWSTPAFAAQLAQVTRQAAVEANREPPWVGIYVRVALEGSGKARAEQEAKRYEGFSAYSRHFERMGARAIETCVIGQPDAVGEGLNRFDGAVDEVIVRAISAAERLDAYLAVLRAAAPARRSM